MTSQTNEKLLDDSTDRYSRNTKNGQFKLDIFGKKYLIKALSQSELADDWLQVLPRKRNRRSYFLINLSELPKNLWHRLQPVYDNKLIHYLVKEKNYNYKVMVTRHDKKIRELYDLIESEYLDLEKIKSYVEYFNKVTIKNSEGKDCKINGWVVLKAKKLLK